MPSRAKFILLFSTMLILKGAAIAVTPSRDEMQRSQQWISQTFAQKDLTNFPFSFILEGMPSKQFIRNWKLHSLMQSGDQHRKIREVTLSDPHDCLQIHLIVTEYADFPAVEWLLEFENAGDQDTPIFEQIKPLDLDITKINPVKFVLHHSSGEYNSAQSFAPVADVLQPFSTLVLYPRGGRSTDGHMPYFNLAWEKQGLVIVIGWSGQWQTAFSRPDEKSVNVKAGMQLTHLSLLPGEKIRTPRILLVFWNGDDDIRGNNLFRQLLIAHYLPRRNGEVVIAPICGSVTEVDPDGSYEGPHLRVMQPLVDRGIEVFWSDMDPQHWYPIGFADGTGTWEPDPMKYPRGLKPIGKAAHAAGLQYLLWFEPERVAPNTRIDQVHPEWVMKRPGEKHGLFKMNDSKARAWLIDYIDAQITAAQLDWLRYDFNIEPLEFWRRNDAPDRQGITEIRYIEGVYALWDELRARHPGLIIDLCASGGRRNDLEALMRGIPLWHSDMQCFGPNPGAEQLQNGGLFRWIPFHGTAAFDYEPSYRFRSAMTTGNIFVSPAPDIVMQRFRQKEAAYFEANGITLTPWHFAGPFHKKGVDHFQHAFEPEKKVNLKKKFGGDIEGWIAKPELQTAEKYLFLGKDSSAYYYYRTILAKEDITCPLFLGSDDGIRLWLNGHLVYENNVDRPLTEASDFVELKLRKGENHLLLKNVNNLKRTGIYFSVFQMDQRNQILDTAFPETEAAVKRSIAMYQKVRPYLMGDFYPLFPHDPSEKVWYGYQFHRSDLNAGTAVVFRRQESQDSIKEISLCATKEEVQYELLNHDSGAKTIIEGKSPIKIELRDKPGSAILFYHQIDK